MPYTSNLGLPQVLIDFKSSASTALIRSSRGTVALILNDENYNDESLTGAVFFTVTDSSEIPTLNDKNTEIVKLALAGTPAKINLAVIPEESWTVEKVVEVTQEVPHVDDEIEDLDDDVDEVFDDDEGEEIQDTTPTPEIITTTETVTETVTSPVTLSIVLGELSSTRFNWIAYPTGNTQSQIDLATWVKTQRVNKNKSYKAVVANVPADNEGVVNFTTSNIKITNPAYTDALTEVNGDTSLVDVNIPQFKDYTTTEFTARIVGMLAGLAMDRSATYYPLNDVVSVGKYVDLEENISRGEFCLFDEGEGNGVKVARGINSLTTYTAAKSTDFRHIRTIEIIDLIKDDISNTFKTDYVGKVVNSYDNKLLFISAIHTYFQQLIAESILSPDNASYVEIDLVAQKQYAEQHSIDTTNYSDEDLRKINTGEFVFLSGVLYILGAMENLSVSFLLQ